MRFETYHYYPLRSEVGSILLLVTCDPEQIPNMNWLSGSALLSFQTGVLTQNGESNISAHCWDVLKVEPVFLSSLWASPPLLFSAEILV